MEKTLFFGGTLFAGLALCVFGNAAFAAAGAVLGVGMFGFGVYFFSGFFLYRSRSVLLGIFLAAGGILLVILCLFVSHVAYFIGGLVLIAAGIALFPLCRLRPRVILPFNIGCITLGLVILFTPFLIGFMAVFTGILLVLYSIALLILL